jgi:hypothetical protein
MSDRRPWGRSMFLSRNPSPKKSSIDLFARTRLPRGPPLFATVMTVGHATNYHTGSRSLAGVPRNGSDCGAGCGTLGPTVGVLVLLGLRGRWWRRSFCGLRLLCGLCLFLQAAFVLTIGAPSPSSRRVLLRLNISYGLLWALCSGPQYPPRMRPARARPTF